MRCFADFVLDSDLCLEPEERSLTLSGPANSISLTLLNAEHDLTRPASVLSAHLLFEAPTFDANLKAAAFAILSEFLNVLTYTTNRKFEIVCLKRIIDWTPGTVQRQAFIYAERPEWDVAEPALDFKFIETAQRLLSMASSKSEQREAMRWYRRAIQSSNIEEQFSCFWFALEILAEASKGPEKVPSKCPKCQGPLFCEACGAHPLHRRYTGAAIQNLIEKVHPDSSDEIFKTLQTIRHTLMHGRRISSVIEKLPCDEQQAVTKLAFVTWQAIFSTFTEPDPKPDEPLNFGFVDNVARRKLVAGALITTTLPGDPHDPQIIDFPKIDVTIKDIPTGPAQQVNENQTRE